MTTCIFHADYEVANEVAIECRVTVEITSFGRPASTYGPPEHCSPAEPIEFEVVSIEVNEFDGREFHWRAIEELLDADQCQAIRSWAESLDDIVADEAGQAAEDDAAAEAEYRRDLREER